MSNKRSNQNTAPEQVTDEEVITTAVSKDATVEQDVAIQQAEQQGSTQTADVEIVSAQLAETEMSEDKFNLKRFFAKIGKAILAFFVSLGLKIRDFFVNCWHGLRRFGHNVVIFFKMLFSLRRKGKETENALESEQLDVADAGVSDTVVAEVAVSTDVIAEESVETENIVDDVAEEDEIEAMKSRFKYFFRKRTKDEWKTFLLGNNEQKGFIQKFVSYALLILFGFVYAYPMLYMLGYSLMGESDVLNPMVNYLPTEWQWSNYSEAAQTLNFFNTLLQTAYISVLPSLLQTAACGLTAYGLARFEFPGKKIIFGLIVLTFIIPPQLTMMPQLIIFTNVGIAGNVLAFMVPAALGQGIKSAVFILIFYQFFRGIPDSVVEAAKIDGANSFQIFWKIGVRSAVPAILLSFLLSVVWYYNETVLSQIYLGGSVKMLPLELEKFQATYEQLFPSSTTGKSVNEAIYMAGTLLNVLPLIIMYFFTQRYFVEGIDKAGITGE